ncbi:MAG: oxidoreductase [Pseudomonadota bacterium]|nr:oxidoreductase [Pseudomonadota bacterium]
MSASPRLGVGLVGNGMAARVFHAPYIAACTGLDLRAVVSRRDEAELPLPGLARVPDIADLLDDPAIDLVVIATPSATHAQLAQQALDAGKHVVVDKPFTLDLASAQDLVARAKRANRVVTAFHNRRGDADFLAIKAAIAAGEIGRVVHFESHFDRFRPKVRERWREDGSEGSGVWFDLGPHLVDQALCLFGAPEAVSADIAALREGGRSDDYAHVTLHYPQMRAILHAGMCVAGGEPRFRVHGTGGSLLKNGIDPQEAQSVAGMRPGDPDWGRDPEPLVRFDGEGARHETPLPRGCQERFYEDVAAACRGEKPVAVSGEDIVLVQAVIEAARAASRTGQRVALAEVLEGAGRK